MGVAAQKSGGRARDVATPQLHAAVGPTTAADARHGVLLAQPILASGLREVRVGWRRREEECHGDGSSILGDAPGVGRGPMARTRSLRAGRAGSGACAGCVGEVRGVAAVNDARSVATGLCRGAGVAQAPRPGARPADARGGAIREVSCAGCPPGHPTRRGSGTPAPRQRDRPRLSDRGAC